MRARRKKFSLNEKDEVALDDNESGEKHQEDLSLHSSTKSTAPEDSIQFGTGGQVIVPKGLSVKEKKKFRKEARRKARTAGRDDTKLTFVDSERRQTDRKRKRDFPSINEMVEESKRKRELEVNAAQRQEAEAALSEEYKARYLAIDCEMVGIGLKGKISALARVSIVNWNGETVLDAFVKVPTKVTDFRTWVSGVTAKDIKSSSAMNEADCRAKVASLLKGKVVVGHALSNDFKALMLTHPKDDIRDTAKYRSFQVFNGNKWRPRSLKNLSQEHLGLTIQVKGESHDSVDDAKAAMELFKYARENWERSLNQSKRRKS